MTDSEYLVLVEAEITRRMGAGGVNSYSGGGLSMSKVPLEELHKIRKELISSGASTEAAAGTQQSTNYAAWGDEE